MYSALCYNKMHITLRSLPNLLDSSDVSSFVFIESSMISLAPPYSLAGLSLYHISFYLRILFQDRYIFVFFQ